MDPDKDFLIEHLAELARKPAEPETRRAVFDPEIPQADLGLLRWRVDRLIAASLIPKPARKFPMAPPWRRFDRVLAMGLTVVTLGLFGGITNALHEEPTGNMIKSDITGLALGAGLATLFIGVWTVAVMVRETIPADRAARVHHGRYLLPDEDLDSTAGELYQRAERALEQIQAASITKAGLLDPELTAADTDRWKWQVTRQLRELTVRRGGLDRPEAQPQKAPNELEAKITDRLAGLERLAATVTDVDAAYQERQEQLAAAAAEDEVTIQEKAADGASLSKDQRRRIRAAAAQIRDELTPPGSKPA